MVASLWLTSTLFSLLVTCFDPSISNGTCYFASDKKAADSYIPCGNSAGGVQSCCQARDICLSSNACYNGQYGVTYLAGCTDQDYEDAKCPGKGIFSSQQWAGLVRCFVSSGSGEEWAPCEEKTQPKVNDGNKTCKCDRSRSTAVFTDAATLTPIASLPVSVGNAIAWSSGFEPSTTISEITPAGLVSSSITTSAMPGTTTADSSFPSPTAPPSSSELSTAAKAGIGVGTAGGVLAISALLLWFGWFRRRRTKAVPPIQDQIRPSSLGEWNEGDHDDIAIKNNHKSWGGKSELPTEANEVTTTKTSLGENTIRTSFNTPATQYQPYQQSPTIAASEMEGSPAGSTSGLAPKTPTMYEKPRYGGPIYEMPG